MVVWQLLLAVLPGSAAAVPARIEKLLDEVRISRGELFPSDVYLVTLKVTDVDEEADDASRAATLQVVHVHAGPRKLADAVFKGQHFGRAILTGGSPLARRMDGLRRGDVGLFFLVQQKTSKEPRIFPEKEVFPANERTGFPICPIIEANRDYRLAVGLAEAIQSVYSATDEKRLRTIDGLLRCGNVGKAYAALWHLKQAKDPRILDYMLELATDKDLPLEIHADIDEWLHDKSKAWSGSPTEFRMIQSWFGEHWRVNRQSATVYSKLPYLSTENEEDALYQWWGKALSKGWYSPWQALNLNNSPPHRQRHAAFAVR
jgi:hypothetical protein